MAEGWSTIESEPAVFHELIKDFGCTSVQVEELWSLDSDSLNALKPVHGLVFLFKWTSEADARPTLKETEGSNVFFARQVISNACATQAILAVLLNAEGLKDKLGAQLTQFREFTAGFPPDIKGLAIGNSDSIRLAHNSFARPEPIVPDEKEATKDDDAFHFISYLPVDGVLYELDGLKEGPIPLGNCSPQDWLDKVVPHIQERMARYAEKEVRFNVMALVADKLEAAEARVQQLEGLRQAAVQRLGGGDPGPLGAELPASRGEVQAQAQSLEAQLAALHEEIQEEQEKRRRWADENVRRRFNYVPFLFNALRLLAERGQMGPLIERCHTLAREGDKQQSH